MLGVKGTCDANVPSQVVQPHSKAPYADDADDITPIGPQLLEAVLQARTLLPHCDLHSKAVITHTFQRKEKKGKGRGGEGRKEYTFRRQYNRGVPNSSSQCPEEGKVCRHLLYMCCGILSQQPKQSSTSLVTLRSLTACSESSRALDLFSKVALAVLRVSFTVAASSWAVLTC